MMAALLLAGCNGQASASPASGDGNGGTDQGGSSPGTHFDGNPPTNGYPVGPIAHLGDDGGTPGSATGGGKGGGGSSGSPGSPSDTGTPSLGTLPAEMAALAWPTRPNITREVTATTAAELEAAIATPGTRIRVRGVSGGDVAIATNDIEILADDATSLGRIHIAKSTQRVRVVGGHWRGVSLEIPATFVPSPSYRPEWLAQDIWLEDLTVNSGSETAFEIRGKRVAILRSDVTAGLFSVWCGDTDHFQTEDLIIFDNRIRSVGPEATLRFVSALRTAVVSNELSNTYKHNYRIHGVSDLNYASDNLLVGTGVMLGTMPGDSLGTMWFDDNVMHHTSPDLFNPSTSAIRVLHARRNMAYTDVTPHFYGGAIPASWDLEDNQVAPYQPAPAF